MDNPLARLILFALAALAGGLRSSEHLSDAQVEQMRGAQLRHAGALCRATLNDPAAGDLQFASAALGLGESVAAGNERLRHALREMAAFKRKIDLMNAHWRDYDRLFTVPNP